MSRFGWVLNSAIITLYFYTFTPEGDKYHIIYFKKIKHDCIECP